MPMVTIPAVGKFGLIADTLPQELDISAWSAGANVRFVNGAAERVHGHSAIFTTPVITPYWITPYTTSAARFWVYAGLGKVYADDGATQTNITPASDFTGAIDDRWTGGSIGGVLVMSNGVEIPHYWAGNTANDLAVLPGWDANWKCKFIRPFKNFLVAGYISKSGTAYPHMIKWCHPIQPGAITALGDWDEGNPALDAGERDLAETPDLLVDALPMGDQLIIYKERSMYSAQQSFDDSVFITRRLPGDVGLLARGCVVDTPVGHVVLTAGDLVVHQGQGTQSVLEGKWRKRLFQFIDSENATRCFLTVNPKKCEVWVCYPLVGATVCTQALVWNWLTGAVGHRDLPNATYGATGQINFAAATTMNGLTGTMDDLFGATDANEFAANEGRLVICTTAPAIYLCDTGATFAGTAVSASLERTGLAFDDPQRRKLVKGIWPRIDAPVGTVLSIQVGGTDDIEQQITWGEAFTYTVGTSLKADVFASGRYIGIRYSSTSVQPWRIHTELVDFKYLGPY